jgi:hypothetical protein
VDLEISITALGLGYSAVEVDVQGALRARLFVLPAPLAGGKIVLRVAMQLHRQMRLAALVPWLPPLPPAFYRPVFEHAFLRGFATDVERDFRIWKHKRYLGRPALAKGDGPIGPYRRWAQQFYVAPRAETGTVQLDEAGAVG